MGCSFFASPLELAEPILRHFLGTDSREGRLRAAIAVPVASTGRQEAKGGGMLSQDGTNLRSVAWVTDLHGVEAFVPESSEGTPGTSIFDVGGRDEATDSVHQISDVSEVRQILLDKRRPATAEVPVEGVLHIRDGATIHQHLGHMRPANGTTTCPLQDLVEIDLHAEAVEPRNHSARPTMAVGATFRQKYFDLF